MASSTGAVAGNPDRESGETTLASKSWRLVVTELGGAAPLSDVRVDAGNWMTALTKARAEIGESGGVPPGASCAMSPEGAVTIHDAVARKTYRLAPDDEAAPLDSLSPKATPRGPQIPADEVPREAAVRVPKPSDPPPARKSAPPTSTIAYDARELDLSGGGNGHADAAPREPAARNRTIAYDARELGLAPPPEARPPESEPPRKKRSSPTIAYDAAELGLAPPAAPSEAPAAKTKIPSHTIAYDAAELGLAPPPAREPAPASEPAPELSPEAAPAAPETTAAAPAGEATEDDEVDVSAWVQLHARDEDPSPESPLLYRERVYCVPPGASEAVLEAILMARFEELFEELADRPRGKLVNMALFDHPWESRPERPPLLTLQWKDWKGEPVVQRPPAEPAARPAPEVPAAPAAAREVAPSEPVSEDDLELGISDDVIDSQAARDRRDVESGRPSLSPTAGGDMLAAAFEALQDLFFLSTPLEGLDFVARLLEDLLPCDAYSACLYDINSDELRFVAVSGPGAEERRGEGVPRLSGLLGAATLEPGECLLLEDVADDPRFDPGVDGRVGLDPKTMAVIAVSHHGRLMGVLQLVNRADASAFTRADANLLAYVAEKLGEFLAAARHRPSTRP